MDSLIKNTSLIASKSYEHYLFSCLCVGISILGLYISKDYYHDDAYITLRYAHNYIQGHGLLWNVGESAVEGYSNFLFLAAVIALANLGIDLILSTKLINLFAYLGIIVIVNNYLKNVQKSQLSLKSTSAINQRFSYYICMLLLVSDSNLQLWSFGGLETVFYCFLLTAGIISFIRYLNSNEIQALCISSIFYCLAGLTRLDAAILILISGLFLLHRVLESK